MPLETFLFHFKSISIWPEHLEEQTGTFIQLLKIDGLFYSTDENNLPNRNSFISVLPQGQEPVVFKEIKEDSNKKGKKEKKLFDIYNK